MAKSLEKTDVGLLADGHAAEWSKFALLLNNLLFRKAFAITKDIHLAQDVMQNVLLSLWKQRHSLGQVKSLLSYAIRSVQNNAISMVRDRNRCDTQSACHDHPEPIDDSLASDPLSKLYQSQLCTSLALSLQTLSAAELKVFRQLEQDFTVSTRRIAKHLGCSHRNVRSVRLRLQRKLHHLYSPERP
jgi:RNA polymerase sigma factor (sigma-70 family)